MFDFGTFIFKNMKTISQVVNTSVSETATESFAIDTTFVLFFLAIEFGQNLGNLALDNIFLALTLLAFVALPYFLQGEDKPVFAKWLLGRSLIAAFAMLLGIMFKQTLGVILPETFRFMPMTLLILTAMISCYIQFYGFLKLREVK
jgi:hypothetical protein